MLLPFCDGASNAKSVVLKLGSAVLLRSAKQFLGSRRTFQKKNQIDAPEERKNLYKKDFQATYLSKPNLANIIGYETLQATYASMIKGRP